MFLGVFGLCWASRKPLVAAAEFPIAIPVGARPRTGPGVDLRPRAQTSDVLNETSPRLRGVEELRTPQAAFEVNVVEGSLPREERRWRHRLRNMGCAM